MKRIFLAALVLILSATTSFAFDAARARELLDILASDAFEGRRPGHAGGTKTEEFLARNLEMIRVEPAGEAGDFQDVPMLVTEEQAAELTLMDHELGRISFVLGADFNVVTHSGSGGIVAPVVIVGYGYHRPDKNRDDYGDVNVANKVVLILRDKPDSPFDFEEDYQRRHTLAWAKERRAAAVLYYQDPIPTYGAAIPAELYDSSLPILYVGDRVLHLLLDGTGYSLKTYKDALKRAPLPLETEKRMWVSTRVRKLDGRTPRNVLGIVYGTDPVLKKEVVVVGGHWDHIGKNAKGVIYNGADDNASGTAIVAEIARSIAAEPLKRTVVFAHFTGEEDGLLGSAHFARRPTVPFGNIVGMINLDCEGAGTGRVVLAGGETFGNTWTEYVETIDSTERASLILWREDGIGASDHDAFMRTGCPVLAFWSRGEHPFYHHYEDDARWISDSVLAVIGTRAEQFVRFLGNHDKQIAFHGDSLRLLARFAVTVDFNGFVVDDDGYLPNVPVVSGAWLPREAAITNAELVRRVQELRHTCDVRNVESAGLAEAIRADRRQQPAVFIWMEERDLAYRTTAEVRTLQRQGISVVRLAPGSSRSSTAAHSEGLDAAQEAGLYALVPFDFAASQRIEWWKDHAIIYTSLLDFAAAPTSVREGLLMSDALLMLEIEDSPNPEQLQSLRPGRERRVHVSFGALPTHRREEHAKSVIRTLYEAGFTRSDILLLTSGNLRRFFVS
ncbi:M28 family peptidase [bacterium]|nr:M28 family peptidase [bacterium]